MIDLSSLLWRVSGCVIKVEKKHRRGEADTGEDERYWGETKDDDDDDDDDVDDDDDTAAEKLTQEKTSAIEARPSSRNFRVSTWPTVKPT